MIITQDLVWMHLPKTAGTTTERLFLASGLSILWNDPQTSPVKHLPLVDHPQAADLPLHGQQKVANFRRLPHWLVSNLQHKRTMMGLEVDDAPMRNGLFWREREKQWLPADWWLDRLRIDDQCILLRVDRLKHDFLACLKTYQPISRASRWRVRCVKSKNRNRYRRNLAEWFAPQELALAYETNPRWAALEYQVYGDLLTHD